MLSFTKRFAITLFFCLLLAAAALAQPRYVGTDIGGSYQAVRADARGRFCNFVSMRAQAASSAAAGQRTWEFLGGNTPQLASAPARDTAIWRPMLPNQTLSGYNAVINAVLQQPSAIKQVNNGGFLGKMPAVTNGNYYTFNVATNFPQETPGYRMAILETPYAPIQLDTCQTLTACVTSSTNSAPFYAANNEIKIRTTYATAPHTGEHVYLAYSTDGTSNFTIVEMAAAATYAEYVFAPSTFLGTQKVFYYSFTSNMLLGQLTQDNAELLSLSMLTNRKYSEVANSTYGAITCSYFSFTVGNPTAASNSLTVLSLSPSTLGNPICVSNSNTAYFVIRSSLVGAATYAWQGQNGNAAATQNDTLGLVNTLSPIYNGVYTVTATNTNGCQATASITLTFYPALNAVATAISPSTCTGVGVVRADPTGGTPPYSYVWSAGANPNTYPIGTIIPFAATEKFAYTVTVTDAVGCTTTMSTTVTQNLTTKPQITGLVVTHPTCKGSNNGKISFTDLGAGYTYTWLPNVSSAASTPATLTPGVYNLTVTNTASGCNQKAAFTIAEPDSLKVQLAQAPSCYKNGTTNNGSLKALPSGGWQSKNYYSNPPFAPYNAAVYTYAWSRVQTTSKDTLINLRYGNCYTVTVTDARLCTATRSICVDSAFALTATAGTAPTCFGGNNGQACVNFIPNTTAAFSAYKWDNANTVACPTNLVAGLHTVTVTYANSCTTSATISVPDNPTPITFAMTTTPAAGYACAGNLNGTICINNVQGGNAPYGYKWTYIGAAVALNNSSACLARIKGNTTYIVTVTATNGCFATASARIAQPNVVVNPVADVTPIRCKGEMNGKINVALTGAITDYTYQWFDNGVAATGNPTNVRTNLAAAVYGLIATNIASGCKGYVDGKVTEPPSLLAASVQPNSVQGVACFGDNTGTACVTTTGGQPPYYYQWIDNLNLPTTINTACTNRLEVGSYTVIVRDTNNCVVNIAASNIVITGPVLPVAVGLTLTNKACGNTPNGKVCVANVDNGTMPYTYLWDSGNQTTLCANALASGTHTVTVTDARGCTASTGITVPAVLLDLVTRDTFIQKGNSIVPYISTTADDGTYSVSWLPTTGVSDPSQISPTFAPTQTTPYTISISKDGCTIDRVVTITILQKDGFAIPNAFTPNGAGPAENDYFRPITTGGVTLTVFRIYNRWGQLVYDGTGSPGWDGSFGNTPQPAGAYIYTLEYIDQNGTRKQASGDVTLLR